MCPPPGASGDQMEPAPPPLPAADDLALDDMLLEVFLRLPSEPHHLLAASLVCRRWRRLVRNPAFLRRFRAFHRSPPVLGFFQNLWRLTHGCSRRSTRIVFISVASSMGSLIPPKPNHCVLDCRHGRVLLHSAGEQGLLVWDPIAGDAHHVSMPPGSLGLEVAAALVYAAGHDDHTDCQSAPFQIVFMDGRTAYGDPDHESKLISAYVYSSETASWSDATSITSALPVDNEATSVIVGTSMYWNLVLTSTGIRNYILEFDMSGPRLALIELPSCVCHAYMSDVRVMLADDGGIGFAGINSTSLHFWSRRTVPDCTAEWVLTRRIDLTILTMSGLPAGDTLWWASMAAIAENGDEIFLLSDAGIFVINIRSLQLRKVLEVTGLPIYPYSSFYARGRDIVGVDDREEQESISCGAMHTASLS